MDQKNKTKQKNDEQIEHGEVSTMCKRKSMGGN